jgi:DUF4097 and DUF4098 domain-containing protein YvlB
MRSLLVISLLVPVTCLADQWNKHFDVAGNPELHLDSGNTALEVRSGSNSGIDLELKSEGLSIAPSEVHIEQNQEGNRLDLRVVPAQRFGWRDHSVSVKVRIPKNTATFIHIENGPVNLDGLYGTAHVNAGNGPVVINGFDGSLEAQTGNGPLTASGRFEGLQLRSGNGPLDLRVDSGSKLESDWHIETGNGSVSVKLPQDVSADLSLYTGSGPLSFDLPIEKRVLGKHSMEAKLNGGGPELSITTGHGPVSIDRL